MKTHLYKKDDLNSFCSAVTECGIVVDVDYIETINHEAVTCLKCKKTESYKLLKESNEHTQKVLEEMNEIKEKSVAEFKESESATYTQTIEVEVEIPIKMEVDTAKITGKSYAPDFSRGTAFLNVSLKPKVKTGDELIGIACFISDVSLDDCLKKASNPTSISIISDYKNGFYRCGGLTWKYAYPVSPEKLKQLLKEVEK